MSGDIPFGGLRRGDWLFAAKFTFSGDKDRVGRHAFFALPGNRYPDGQLEGKETLTQAYTGDNGAETTSPWSIDDKFLPVRQRTGA